MSANSLKRPSAALYAERTTISTRDRLKRHIGRRPAAVTDHHLQRDAPSPGAGVRAAAQRLSLSSELFLTSDFFEERQKAERAGSSAVAAIATILRAKGKRRKLQTFRPLPRRRSTSMMCHASYPRPNSRSTGSYGCIKPPNTQLWTATQAHQARCLI